MYTTRECNKSDLESLANQMHHLGWDLVATACIEAEELKIGEFGGRRYPARILVTFKRAQPGCG